MPLFQYVHMELYTPSLKMNWKDTVKQDNFEMKITNFASFSLNLTLKIMHMSKQ